MIKNIVTAAAVALVTAQAQSANLLSEGFDLVGALPASGWVQQNLSSPLGSTGWSQGNPGTFYSYSGTPDSYISANFNNAGTVSPATISDWLITPVLSFAQAVTLSFYTRTVDLPAFADHLEVRLSTSGASTDVGSTETSVGAFTTLLVDINPTLVPSLYPNVWTLYTVNIAALGGTGRLAFHYAVPDGGLNGQNSDYIGIDNVSVDTLSAVPEPASAGLLAAGLLGLMALRRTRRTRG